MKQNNLFICQTPFQNYIVRLIIDKYFQEGFTNYVISTKGELIKSNNINFFNIKRKFIIDQFIDMVRAKKIIKHILAEDDADLEVFLPHTGGILSNYLFHKNQRDKDYKLSFYYEGILFLYDYVDRYSSTHFFRKILGSCLGFKYKFDSTIYPYNSHWIYRIYTPFPMITLGPSNKIVEIELTPKNFVGNQNTLLIIGGSPTILSKLEVQSIYQNIVDEIKKSNQNAVIFKPHHADKSSNFEIVAKRNNFKYEYLVDARPIEEIIHEIKPCKIYSYPSSGIVNIKGIYGDKIKTRIFYSEKMKNHFLLEEIFKSLNVRINYI